MLSCKEKKVMSYIYTKCEGKTSQLISPEEISNYLVPKYDVGKVEMDEIINNLVLENYITMIMSEKKGQPIYCISLTQKGEGFEREQINAKKNIRNLIVRTILLAILSFVVGLILKAIF